MLRNLIAIAVLTYLGFGLLIFLGQRAIMYHPVPARSADDVTVEYVDSAGASLKLWVVNPGMETAVIYFGGNAEDVYLNAADFRQTLPRTTVYLVNYRGYGGSSGLPSEQALFSDVLYLYDRLSGRHSRIDAIGRSLGSGVATFLAAGRPVARLVLITPYDSAVSLARRLYPFYPVSLLLWDRYESSRYAARVRARTLVLTAGRDRVVPPQHSQRLVDALAPGLVQQTEIRAAGHNDLSAYREYWRQIGRFLD